MKGIITTRDLVFHPLCIIQAFGFRVYMKAWKCVWNHKTFLDAIK